MRIWVRHIHLLTEPDPLVLLGHAVVVVVVSCCFHLCVLQVLLLLIIMIMILFALLLLAKIVIILLILGLLIRQHRSRIGTPTLDGVVTFGGKLLVMTLRLLVLPDLAV